MLVLTRHKGETLLIGNDIRLTVLELEHGQVSLGTEAPRHTRIIREEHLQEDKTPGNPTTIPQPKNRR